MWVKNPNAYTNISTLCIIASIYYLKWETSNSADTYYVFPVISKPCYYKHFLVFQNI